MLDSSQEPGYEAKVQLRQARRIRSIHAGFDCPARSRRWPATMPIAGNAHLTENIGRARLGSAGPGGCDYVADELRKLGLT